MDIHTQTKDRALEKFQVWKALMEIFSGLKVKCLRLDNGLEFYNSKFEEILLEMESEKAQHSKIHPSSK